jgi:hypothetical protein
MSSNDPYCFLRRCVLGIFLLGMVGCAIELLLLEHFEDPWQMVPLGLFALGAAVLVLHALVRRAALVRIFQLTMILFLLGGLLGIGLHYKAKADFARDMHPELTGMSLMREALKGQMPPVLAPGMMAHLGLLGLAWTWRHPLTNKGVT